MIVDLDFLLSDSKLIALVNPTDYYKLLQHGEGMTLKGLPVLLNQDVPQGKVVIIEVDSER